MIKPSYLIIFLIIIILLIVLIFRIVNLHPIFLIIILLFYTIVTCLIISIWNFNFIFSIILYLIIISGLLIIFIYFSSLISNEQNQVPWKTSNLFLICGILIILLLPLTKILNYIPYQNIENIPLQYTRTNLLNNAITIYYYPFNNFTFLAIIFLLITLFIIIKICSKKSSSLRKIH